MFNIRLWNEDGYSWYEGGRCFITSRKRAKRFDTTQAAWEVIADLRQSGFGRRDEGPQGNLSVQPV